MNIHTHYMGKWTLNFPWDKLKAIMDAAWDFFERCYDVRFQLAFAISILILVITIWYAVKHSKKNRIGALTLGTYIMLFVMIFPFGLQHLRWEFIQHTIISIVKTAQVVGLNRELETGIESYGLPACFVFAYTLWLTILYLLAPLLTAGFILNFSRRIRCWFRWRLNRKKEVWIFAEPSEKALMFAESVLQKDSKEDVCVVFCDAEGEYYDRIVEINAIAVLKNIEELDRDYLTRKPVTLLFMSDDEQHNLEQTVRFARRRKSDITRPTLLYCFNSRPEAGLLLNTMSTQDNNKLCLCRISENRALVYQELLQIGADLREIPEGETIHFLIVGFGWIGTEILKALLWFCVRHKLVIDVIDSRSVKDRFYQSCPGLLSEEDARNGFEINFIENEDINAFDISHIKGAADIRYAYVSLGNDIANIECSVYLRQAFRRLHILRGDSLDKMPEIHTVISTLEEENTKLIDHRQEYDIRPLIMGITKTLLDYELEKQALLDHLAWEYYYLKKDDDPKNKEKNEKKKNRIISFVKNDLQNGNISIKNHAMWRNLVLANDFVSNFYEGDYSSSSSRARAVFERCFEHDPSAEHSRWIVYMLTEGYQYGRKTDHLAKLHSEIRLQTEGKRKSDDERDLEYQEVLKLFSEQDQQ